MNFKTNDPVYSTLTAYSNIDCYNKCINDINCTLVEKNYKKIDNCLLKSVFNYSNQQSLESGSEAFTIGS